MDLLGLTPSEIRERLGDRLDKPFRADQIYGAIYRHGARSFEEMTTLSLALRRDLQEEFRIGVPEVVDQEVSTDGTTKFLFRLADGVTIETVDIPSPRRRTLCLSSQAGCALACTFCVTGYWGGGRNLSAGEILGQVLGVVGHLPYGNEGLNLVMMGMGEPLHNLQNLHRALEMMSEAISWRRITVSTVGAVEGIRELATWPERPNLAVSLHAPDDERRDRIMPINRTHPLEELFAALGDFPLESHRKITFEYLLIRDFNDQDTDADALARRIARVPGKVNLIPVNPDSVLGPEMVPPSAERVQAFAGRLRKRGVLTTVRQRRGDDVSAACGQLRSPTREPRGFRRSNLSF